MKSRKYHHKDTDIRRHHNNKGLRQIKNGSTDKQIKIIAKKLGIKYE